MNNKSKYHQSVKVEKENENVKLRKKSKSLTTDKHLINKKETVWDRLSKIKKVSSSEKAFEVANLAPSFTGKIHRRYQPADHTLLKQSKQPSKKLLNLNSNSVKKHLDVPQKTLLQRPEITRELDNELLHEFAFEEITTCRSLSSDSKYSSDCTVDVFKFPEEYAESLHCSDRRKADFSETSIEEYTLAPLLASCPEDGTESNVGKFLRYNSKPMHVGGNDLALDGISSDNRCEVFADSPQLQKHILKRQVENILTQEFAVKEVLRKLESSLNLQQKFRKDFPEQRNKIVEYCDLKNEIQKFEVDVTFRNVPSLGKEIEILRALGEKLEATLNSTNIPRNRQTSISQISTTKPSEVLDEKEALLTLKVKHDFKTEHFASVSIQLSGVRQCVGIINEFSVAQKSIVELKREASRHFFIPSNCQNSQLMKTSFKNLQENPNELFRLVKPRDSQIAFNVLDQDPIFFYSTLNKLSTMPSTSLKNNSQNNERQLQAEQDVGTCFGTTANPEAVHKDTNCLIGKTVPNIMVTPSFEKKKKRTPGKSFPKAQTNFEPDIRGETRRRIRRLVTPMPIGYYYCPKNSVFKTILVGFAQVSLFIVFIVALTYPGLRCLSSSVYT